MDTATHLAAIPPPRPEAPEVGQETQIKVRLGFLYGVLAVIVSAAVGGTFIATTRYIELQNQGANLTADVAALKQQALDAALRQQTDTKKDRRRILALEQNALLSQQQSAFTASTVAAIAARLKIPISAQPPQPQFLQAPGMDE